MQNKAKKKSVLLKKKWKYTFYFPNSNTEKWNLLH